MACTTNTTVVTDNNPDPCDGEIKSTACVAHPSPINFLSLPAGSTQEEINAALVAYLIQVNNRLNDLENV